MSFQILPCRCYRRLTLAENWYRRKENKEIKNARRFVARGELFVDLGLEKFRRTIGGNAFGITIKLWISRITPPQVIYSHIGHHHLCYTSRPGCLTPL